jgi:glycosyltransferase involved in cell wall biosynthesis
VTRKRIVYLLYGNPAAYPPLERSAAQLSNAGWDVLFLGAHTPGVESLTLAPQPRTTVVLLPGGRGGWRLKRHYLWFCVWACWRALLYRPRWIYASDVLSAPIALLLKTVFGKRVLYHEHDAYDLRHASGFMRGCLTAARYLSRVSDLNVLPSEGRIEWFCRQNATPHDRCACVWNCPSLAEVRASRPDGARQEIRLLFQGSIVPARLPLAVLHAMTKVPENVTLRLIGYGTIDSKGYIDRLKEEATRLKLGTRLEFMGAISRHADLLARSDVCDIGLALMPLETDDVNMRFMAGASNKAFEYLACGLPILVSARAEWQAMFVAPGYALSCDPEDADSIAEALQWYVRNPDRAREMGENGRRRILSDWNYEAQFAPVFRVLTGDASTGVPGA